MEFKSNCIEFEFCEGNIKNLLLICINLVKSGWRLVVDPLGGYISRPNPFHTIILEIDKRVSCKAQDFLKLEYLLKLYFRQLGDYEKASKENWEDYMELDYSLALNAIKGLVKYNGIS